MPSYRPSIPFSDFFGSVGEKTYYHWKGSLYYKRKAQPSFPGTPAQLEQLDVHRRAIAAWQSLGPEVQAAWYSVAPGMPSKQPPFERRAHITGYNLFVSAYHGFATLGNEHVPEPLPCELFPDFFLDLESVEVEQGSDLRFRFFCSIGAGFDGSRYRLLMKLQLCPAGRGKKPGLMRNFLAESVCPESDGSVEFLVEDFRSVWNLELQAFSAHCKFVLLDTVSGYRGRYCEKSFRLF